MSDPTRVQRFIASGLSLSLLLLMGGCEDAPPPPSVKVPAPGAVAPPTTTPPAGGGLIGQQARTEEPDAASEPAPESGTVTFLGVVAPVPVTWQWQTPRGQRKLQYAVPGVDGADAADLIGTWSPPNRLDEGESQIDVWTSQFRSPDGGPVDPLVETLVVRGLSVVLVELEGEYLGVGGGWHRPDTLFLAALIATPDGEVTVRMVGPAVTVEAGRSDFLAFINGLDVEHPTDATDPGTQGSSVKSYGTRDEFGVPLTWLEGRKQQRAIYRPLYEARTAPELTVTGWINSDPLTLSELKGKVVLLDFWGTWCQPCMRSFPHLKRMLERYQKHGLVIIGVCNRRQSQSMQDVATAQELPWPLCIDSTGATEKTYRVDGFPDYTLIGRGGRVRVADARSSKLEEAIEFLLMEDPDAGE